MRLHTGRLRQGLVPWAVILGMTCLSYASEVDNDAQVRARSRFMLEQLRAYQLARQAQGGGLVAKSVEPKSKVVKPEGKLSPLESMIKKTYDRLLAGPISCCLCSIPANCNDSLYCNGPEVCQTGRCAAGAAPCVDGDPCTTDLCTENTDTCSHNAVPPPPEVASLSLGRVMPASPVAALAWSSVSGATAYNVYRGTLAGLGDLTCFAGGLTGTSGNDDGSVPVRAYYYLVTSRACGESGLGTGHPNPRPPAPGCP